MHIETGSKQTSKPISHVGEENMEETGTKAKTFYRKTIQPQRICALTLIIFDVSVALTEIQTDEMDNEFAETVEEIDD